MVLAGAGGCWWARGRRCSSHLISSPPTTTTTTTALLALCPAQRLLPLLPPTTNQPLGRPPSAFVLHTAARFVPQRSTASFAYWPYSRHMRRDGVIEPNRSWSVYRQIACVVVLSLDRRRGHPPCARDAVIAISLALSPSHIAMDLRLSAAASTSPSIHVLHQPSLFSVCPPACLGSRVSPCVPPRVPPTAGVGVDVLAHAG